MVTLTSDDLAVAIQSAGAEVSSVKNREGTEFMWQADKEVWPRHAPVLFPIVGKLKNDSFIFKDRHYQLGQHGFARDLDFQLIQSGKESCVFQLRSSNETKSRYPFDFVFDIGYQLKGNTLTTTYSVSNPSSGTIYFSVGAHPGFNCPIDANEKFEDYYLEFESDEYARTELQNGLLSHHKTELILAAKKLPLYTALFEKDALVFENSQISAVSLCSATSKHKISMQCQNWPFFGIWTKKGSNRFVCLEPWYGIADTVDSGQVLTAKKGIMALAAGQSFSCSFSMSFV